MRPDPRRDGLTPRPDVADLRPWDRILLSRYRPVYHPVHTQCAWCALGPCDLEAGRRGACGQTPEVLAAREALMLAVSGACAHAAHARDVVEHLQARFGPDLRLDLGPWVHIRTPIIELVVGKRPRRLRDLLDVLDYVDAQLVKLNAATHFGGESAPDDLESKTLHAGTMDLVALEVADVAQIAAYRFPRGEPETPLVPLGLGQVDTGKPLILCVGHHSAVGQRIGELLREQGLDGRIELVGLCCTAHDMARAPETTVKIVGNQRDQLRFARAGVADVVVADQQCVRLDLKEEVLRTGACFIATSEQACAGLPDETDTDPELLACRLVERAERATFVADPERAARLAVALALRGKRAHPSAPAPIAEDAAPCTKCEDCDAHCPLALPVAQAVGVRRPHRAAGAGRPRTGGPLHHGGHPGGGPGADRAAVSAPQRHHVWPPGEAAPLHRAESGTAGLPARRSGLLDPLALRHPACLGGGGARRAGAGRLGTGPDSGPDAAAEIDGD